ncbi:MAG TPA: hypothetical protein VGH32_11410, partial [Pirellulales bacterium]
LWRSPYTPPWARRHAVLLLGAIGIYTSQMLFHELSYSQVDNLLIFFLAGVQAGLRPLAVAVPARGIDPAGYLPFFAEPAHRSLSSGGMPAMSPS